MNKKLIGNLFLIALVVGLALTFLDPVPADRSFQEQIQAFVEERISEQEDGITYTPLTFEEITEAFLMSREEISEPLLVIADTVRNQLDLMKRQYVSEDFRQMLSSANDQLEGLSLITLAGYLKLDAQLKRSLKQAGLLNAEDKAMLYKEETRMLNAVNELNMALGDFNLSVFSLDFQQAQTVLYYHSFELTDRRGATRHHGVFELSREEKEVITYKEI